MRYILYLRKDRNKTKLQKIKTIALIHKIANHIFTII